MLAFTKPSSRSFSQQFAVPMFMLIIFTQRMQTVYNMVVSCCFHIQFLQVRNVQNLMCIHCHPCWSIYVFLFFKCCRLFRDRYLHAKTTGTPKAGPIPKNNTKSMAVPSVFALAVLVVAVPVTGLLHIGGAQLDLNIYTHLSIFVSCLQMCLSNC